MANTTALIEQLAVEAANRYLSSGENLNDIIAGQAVFYQLTGPMIQRVVERANRIVFLKNYGESEDKTFNFPLADFVTIMKKLRGSPAEVIDNDYNLDDVNFDDATLEPHEEVTNEDFYNEKNLPGEEEIEEIYSPTKPQPEPTVPNKKSNNIYVVIVGGEKRPNMAAIERLLLELKKARQQEKLAGLFSKNKLSSIKDLFMQVVRAGVGVGNAITGVFTKLPTYLKNKAVPVVQKIIDELFREGKITEKPDVSMSLMKFGEADPYLKLNIERVDQVVDGIKKLAEYEELQRSAAEREFELLKELQKVQEEFPDLEIGHLR